MSAMSCEPLCQFGERLFFTSFPDPPPSEAAINKLAKNPANVPPLRPRCQPHDAATYHYFTIDNRLSYFSFYEDWGPLNLAMVYKACILIHELLEDAAPQRLVLYSSSAPRPKANAALLMALFAMIVQRRTPWEAFQPIAEVEFIAFRDAGRGPSDFNLNIQDCLWGVWKAQQNGLLDMNDFDVEDYEYYEKVEHGDWNWISPHFIAFASPLDPLYIKAQREGTPVPETGLLTSSTSSNHALQRKLPVPFLNCLEYFVKRNVQLVVRLNTKLYDSQTFQDQGIDHLELYFDDGTNPTDEIVRKFLDVADKIIEGGGVVAVHCKAGLGRTGSLIGAYLIYKYGFTANEAIAFMRILRPGSVVGPQQQYMYLKQLEWSKWAAVDDVRKQQAAAFAAEAAAAPALVTPATPPADTDEEFRMETTPPPVPPTLLPPVTPSKHVAAAAAKAHAIATPGQPRKTPNGKRVTRPDDSSDEDEIADVITPLDLAPALKTTTTTKAGPKVTPSSERSTRVTRSTTGSAPRRTNTTAAPASPTKASNAQGPPKIPRLAATKTPKAAAAQLAGASSSRRANPPLPTPSRLPTLTKRTLLTDIAAASTRNKAASSDAWMTTNVAAVVVPGTKSQRTGLRPIRRRRSSFSNAEGLV